MTYMITELDKARTEILRLQDAKRRALAIADERSKENVELRAALMKAKSEIKWWADEHGCCAGHEREVMQMIEASLEQSQEK